MRTTKDIAGIGDVNYVYENGLLLQMDYLNYIYDFSYDANGTPVGFKFTTPSGAESHYYYGLNYRGDIVAIYNSAGTKVASYSYDAYGKPLTTTHHVSGHATAVNNNPLRYRGYVYDRETGFYYLQSRYYDPVTCRFVNLDGYCATGQGITGNNMYAYCNNNPICYADFNGCWTVGLNANANITLILGASVGIGFYFDDNGNFDIQWNYAVPWVNETAHTGLFDVGLAGGLQFMNVDTVDDLCGYSSATGFSVGSIGSVGLDILSTDKFAEADDTIDGFQINAGVGLGVDIHNVTSFTSSLLRGNDDFNKYYHRHTLIEKRLEGGI